MLHGWLKRRGISVLTIWRCSQFKPLSQSSAETLRGGSKRPAFTVLLLVENQEAVIEGVIRDLGVLASVADKDFDVVVMDLGSNDDTKEIVHKLTREYSNLAMVTDPTDENSWDPVEIARDLCDGETILQIKMDVPVKPRWIIQGVTRIIRGEPYLIPAGGPAIEVLPNPKRLKAV